jgi:hypothetical protein
MTDDLACAHGSLANCPTCLADYIDTEAILAELEEGFEGPCDECGALVHPETAAPSCGAHELHIDCAAWFRCKWCREEQTDYPDEVPC